MTKFKKYCKSTIFLEVDCQTFLWVSRMEMQQPNIDQRKSCSPNFQKTISAKNITVYVLNSWKIANRKLVPLIT
jgi:hypothetical protein